MADDHTEVRPEWWVRSHAVLPAVGVSPDGVPEAFVHVRIVDGESEHTFVMSADDADMLALHVMDCASLARSNAAPVLPVQAVQPHSRACGAWAHPHGRDCHPNCPTCGGLPFG